MGQREAEYLIRHQSVDDTHLAQHSATGGPAEALAQTIEEPQGREGGDGGGPGEEHIDASHHKQANGEEPAGANLVRQHAADELTDRVGQGLAAGDHAWVKKIITGLLLL